jgi:glucose-1-phosphate adenylyltransferase
MATIWYRGTADALLQNIYILERVRPRYVLILSGDHIYKMDYARMLAYHVEKRADLTIACIEVTREEAHRFGIMQVDGENRIIEFEEKPGSPKPLPGVPDAFLGSMGVYVFNTEELVRQVIADAKRDTQHDFGKNIIPRMIHTSKVYVYNFTEDTLGNVYWRDIGTLDAYWRASMDLLGPHPPFELADPAWPMRTYREQHPPAMIVSTAGDGRSCVENSLISAGALIRNARVTGSVISPRVTIEDGASVQDSIIMEGTVIGTSARIRNTIIDKNVHLPSGTEIGFDPAKDRRRFTVTDSGVVVIPKEMPFEQPAEVMA